MTTLAAIGSVELVVVTLIVCYFSIGQGYYPSPIYLIYAELDISIWIIAFAYRNNKL